MKIAVIIATYNRVNQTIKCIRRLNKNTENTFEIFICDSNSTEDISCILSEFKNVNIYHAGNNIYWNRAMNIAWQKAFNHDNFDFFLWLNNDTFLFEDGLTKILSDYNSLNKRSIITGTTVYKNELTYGGRYKLSDAIVKPNGLPQKVKFMNGNCVLIPKIAINEIGYLDNKFSHSLGDIDYGLRAVQKGFGVYISGYIIGNCKKDNKPWHEAATLKERYINMISPKGVPLNEYFYFNFKHFGILKAIKFLVASIVALIFPNLYNLLK